MLNSTYQRVGALAGLLLFIGSWLTGYYNNWLLAAATVAAVVVAFWTALESDMDEENGVRIKKGFIAGLIAGVLARLLGLLTMAWAFDSWTSPVNGKYDNLSDMFRVLYNGDFWASVLAILGVALAGAFVAYSLPYFSADREEE
jgi:hypothetical protein